MPEAAVQGNLDPALLLGPVERLREQVARIKAAVQIHNAADDPWVNAGAPAYEAALKAASVRFEAYSYPGTLHGFHNDTTPRYDEAAAKLAWQRTVAFLHRHLGG